MSKPLWLRIVLAAVSLPPLALGLTWLFIATFLDMGSRSHRRLDMLFIGVLVTMIGGVGTWWAFTSAKPSSGHGFPIESPRDPS